MAKNRAYFKANQDLPRVNQLCKRFFFYLYSFFNKSHFFSGQSKHIFNPFVTFRRSYTSTRKVGSAQYTSCSYLLTIFYA